MSSRVGLAILVLLCGTAIVYQRLAILDLQTQLGDSSSRGKRSLRDYREENEVKEDYLPIYAEMTKTQLRRLCERHSITIGLTTPRSNKKNKIHKNTERKHCSADGIPSTPQIIAKRRHRIGAVSRDGTQWYVFEFHLGYSLLVYENDSALVENEPTKIVTLPYPFHGTDSTVHNGTVVYLFGESLIAYNVETQSTRHHAINASMEPLYTDSTSRIDAGADEHGVWVLYKERGVQDSLTALRLHLRNLKELGRWQIKNVHPSEWCNAFVRCGVLFAVRCNKKSPDDRTTSLDISMKPVFDFYQNRLMQEEAREQRWSLNASSLSSVQFDPLSRTLNAFADGNIAQWTF